MEPQQLRRNGPSVIKLAVCLRKLALFIRGMARTLTIKSRYLRVAKLSAVICEQNQLAPTDLIVEIQTIQ
jgi:hypothetical protein